MFHWHKKIISYIDNRTKLPSHASDLQLTVRGLNRLLTVLLLAAGDLATLPAKRSETLGEDGVRVVVASIDGVSVHGAQILDLELQERRSKLVGVSKVLGEFIYKTLSVQLREYDR